MELKEIDDLPRFSPAIERLAPPEGEQVYSGGPTTAGEPLAFRERWEIESELSRLTIESLCAPFDIRDADMARCVLSGLWLAYGYLDRSHVISQEVETPTGSFWHGIMHRREGDFKNSKYWFRRVGRHSVFPVLTEEVRSTFGRSERSASLDQDSRSLVESATWDPYRFVDLCQRGAKGNGATQEFTRLVERIEWRLLFRHSFEAAIERPKPN